MTLKGAAGRAGEEEGEGDGQVEPLSCVEWGNRGTHEGVRLSGPSLESRVAPGETSGRLCLRMVVKDAGSTPVSLQVRTRLLPGTISDPGSCPALVAGGRGSEAAPNKSLSGMKGNES